MCPRLLGQTVNPPRFTIPVNVILYKDKTLNEEEFTIDKSERST